jgi:glycerate-2-kinase
MIPHQSSTPWLRQHALQLFSGGIKAVHGGKVVLDALELDGNELKIQAGIEPPITYDLDEFKKIIVVGAGKASAQMARAVELLLHQFPIDGMVVTKYGFEIETKIFRVVQAGHPMPDENGLKAAREIFSVLQTADENDLVINLISGGASALLPLPVDGITLEEKRHVTGLLIRRGADIVELNSVRKHCSKLKGGGFAKALFPSSCINLIVSDVLGDRLDTIGSGMATPDTTTYQDALETLDKYLKKDEIPTSILEHLQRGNRGEIPETPKANDPAFRNIKYMIIASNATALEAIRNRAEVLGYDPQILNEPIKGEASTAAEILAKNILKAKDDARRIKRPICLISGGETTVTVKGSGIGGRNQELALALAIQLDGIEKVAVLSCGTDGNDADTDVAGAIIDSSTIPRSQQLGLDPHKFLDNNDSHTFFKLLGDCVNTGKTGTNVMDVQIALIEP